jgi:hypothetical protein
MWVCVCERESEGRYQACRIVFGAEPKDHEVLSYLQEHYFTLPFSTPMAVDVAQASGSRRINPKRMERLAARAMESQGIGTKAQQALSQARDESARERRKRSKEKKITISCHRRETLIAKRRQKHRGH